MITRRGSLALFLNMGLVVPLGAAACMGEGGADESVARAELGISDGEAEDTVIEIDPETARRHKEELMRCLQERGIAVPKDGNFAIKLTGRPPGADGQEGRRRVRMIAKVDGAGPSPSDVHVVELDEEASRALAACHDPLALHKP